MDILSILLIVLVFISGGIAGYIISLRRRPPHPIRIEGKLPSTDGETEILRAFHNNAGQLCLEMEETIIEGPEMLQTRQRQKLVAFLIRLRPWLEAAPVSSPPALNRESHASIKAALFSSPPALNRKPHAPIKAAQPVPSPAAPILSIVEQINEILQIRLVGTPLAERGIRLQEKPGEGVIVQVGLSKYEGVADVPDADVRDAIRQAIADWESRPH